jgi:hypothetical protein
VRSRRIIGNVHLSMREWSESEKKEKRFCVNIRLRMTFSTDILVKPVMVQFVRTSFGAKSQNDNGDSSLASAMVRIELWSYVTSARLTFAYWAMVTSVSHCLRVDLGR